MANYPKLSSITQLPLWTQNMIADQSEAIEELHDRLAYYQDYARIIPPGETTETIVLKLGERKVDTVYVQVKENELHIKGWGMIYVHPISPDKVSITLI
tara:strand:+ start:653 stop:949 length:297 start_codon:yes stop_codon:yes gene_type:complete